MTASGAAIGLGGAVAIGSRAAAVLDDMKGSDPWVLAISAVTLSVVSMLAGFVPAHRLAGGSDDRVEIRVGSQRRRGIRHR